MPLINEVTVLESGGVWLPFEEETSYTYNELKFYKDQSVNIETTVQFDNTGVLILDNGIISNNGVTTNDQLKFLTELTWWASNKMRPAVISNALNQCLHLFNVSDVKYTPGTCLNLYCDWSNWNVAHFLLDIGTKLHVTNNTHDLNIHQFDYVCLPELRFDIAKQVVEQLQLPPEKIITHTLSNSYNFDKVYTPSLNGKTRFYRKNYFNTINNLFNRSTTHKQRYFIMRGETGRNIFNIQQVNDVLDKYSFKVIDFKTSIDIVSLMREASIVVSAHGAGLSNMVFCHPETVLIEFIPEFYIEPYYYSLAYSKEFIYYGIVCKDSFHTSPPDINISFTPCAEKSFIVDVALFEDVLNEAIQNIDSKNKVYTYSTPVDTPPISVPVDTLIVDTPPISVPVDTLIVDTPPISVPVISGTNTQSDSLLTTLTLSSNTTSVDERAPVVNNRLSFNVDIKTFKKIKKLKK
jgi:hypothetical protein